MSGFTDGKSSFGLKLCLSCSMEVLGSSREHTIPKTLKLLLVVSFARHCIILMKLGLVGLVSGLRDLVVYRVDVAAWCICLKYYKLERKLEGIDYIFESVTIPLYIINARNSHC